MSVVVFVTIFIIDLNGGAYLKFDNDVYWNFKFEKVAIPSVYRSRLLVEMFKQLRTAILIKKNFNMFFIFCQNMNLSLSRLQFRILQNFRFSKKDWKLSLKFWKYVILLLSYKIDI